MNKTIRIYIGILILLIGGALVFEFSKPTPVNWSPTFNERHTYPYGLKVLKEELTNLFKNQDIENIRTTPYEYFDKKYNWQDSSYTINGNYLYINSYYENDDVSTQELLHFAAHGNTVFIAANNFSEKLKDSLKIEVRYQSNFTSKGTAQLANPAFKGDTVYLDKRVSRSYFSKVDSINTLVLGYQNFEKKRINYVRVNYKNGYFYLHTQPYIFTNYYLLKNDHYKYVEGALSYLPDEAIFFDTTANKIGADLGGSKLRFINSKPALAWAWRLALVTLLIFMFFNAKRRQRIVKIINPLKNTTVEFTRTIGNLYFETRDHENIIDKKITYFLERIRSDLYLDTQQLDDKFIHLLSLKTGNNRVKVKKLIDLIVYLRSKKIYTEDDLLRLNKSIEEFYNKQ